MLTYSRAHLLPDFDIVDANSHALKVTPFHAVTRRAKAWKDMKVEVIQSLTRNRLEFRFRSRCHLLLVYQEGIRDEGETSIGDLARSSLRVLRGRLTFVPAGQEYCEWQTPRVPTRLICVYFEPDSMPFHTAAGSTTAPIAPCLLFENNVLWETAVKLAAAIEDGSEPQSYSEALGIVLAHELLRIHPNDRRRTAPTRGGLAVRHQRAVVSYIEEHLSETISLATLAKLADLSPYYFCRAFKQSFGVTPHRYHIKRRVDSAKALLANPTRSVTDIGLELGFSETSSFSTSFRHTTGITPTEYRRTLG
jgi:AraC family transcriptional regulator